MEEIGTVMLAGFWRPFDSIRKKIRIHETEVTFIVLASLKKSISNQIVGGSDCLLAEHKNNTYPTLNPTINQAFNQTLNQTFRSNDN